MGLTYFPFGFVLASVHHGRSVVRTAVLIAFSGAVGTEYAQSWFVGRHADITDIAVFALGGLLGAWFGGRGAEVFESARASAVAARLDGSSTPSAQSR